MPDRAGVKLSYRNMVLFVLRLLPTLPKMFASRPSVVDPKIQAVGVPSPCAFVVANVP